MRNPTTIRRQLFRFRRQFAFAAVATVLALVAVEVILRLTGAAVLPAEHFFSDAYDSNYTMLPRASNPWVDVEEFLNSGGFRGRDTNPRRVPGTYRILSLGDSTTFGTQVRNEQTYTYLTGENLRRQNVSVETINAGMPGSILWKQTIIFEKQFKHFDLDLVILYANYGLRRDLLELRRFMDENRVRMKIRGGLVHLHLYRWLRLWLRPPNFTAHVSQHPELDWSTFVNSDPDPYVRERVRRYVEQDLARLRDGCAAIGAKLLVVPLLSRVEFHDLRQAAIAPGTPAWDAFLRESVPSHKVLDLAARLDIPAVAAHADFFRAYEQEEMFLDACHFTAAGHVVMARVLADTICGKNLLPVPCRPPGI